VLSAAARGFSISSRQSLAGIHRPRRLQQQQQQQQKPRSAAPTAQFLARLNSTLQRRSRVHSKIFYLE